MFVVSRKRNESLVIGDGIVVTVVDILDDRVRIGIEAPQEVPVHRKEVYEALRRSGQPSSSNEPPKSPAPPALSLDSAIDLLLRASSARLSPEESAAAKLLLEAVRTKLK